MKKEVIIILLVLILTISSVSYNYSTLFFSRNIEENQNLPFEKIINSISDSQKDLILQKGYVLIYYNFSNFDDEIKNYLENFVENNNAYLIENQGKKYLKIESLKGSREKENPTLNETINIICEISIYRPLDCILREVS